MQRARAPDEGAGRKEGYLVVFPFMMRELGLQGVELLVFARIYGFCRCGLDFFESRQQTADFLGTTKRSVINAVNSLVEKGLIAETGKRGNRSNATKRYVVASQQLEAIGVHFGSGPSEPKIAVEASESEPPRGEDSSPRALLGDEVFSLLDGAY